MELLVLGIDAGVKRVFDSFDMPFLQKKLKEGNNIKTTEDIISRGWVKTYTGSSAEKNLGFYEYPVIDKKGFEWSKTYNQKHLKNSGTKPIWEDLSENQVSCGFMNVPTTSPAPKNVNGFFIAGGGGGKELKNGFDDTICFPESYSEILTKNKYILDERVPSLVWEKGIKKYDQFFKKLIEMTEIRINTFIELHQKRQVQFGYLAIRSVVVTQFLAMSEIEKLIKDEKPINSDLSKNLKKFYSKLDKLFERLFETINPQNHIILSDHGMSILTERLCLNKFLAKKNFQKPTESQKYSKKLINDLKHFIPYSIRRKIKRSSSFKEYYMSMVPFDKNETKAFSRGTVNGIFINDKKRFNGPVELKDVEQITEQIIESINKDKEFIERGITAVKFKLKHNPNTSFYDFLPDIFIENNRGLKFVEQGDKVFLSMEGFVNKPYKLTEVKDDNWTGVKDFETLLCVSDDLFNRSQDLIKQDNDLTLVYNLIKRNFNL